MDSRRAILTYHSLDESGSVISVRPERFVRQMEALAASGLKVIALPQLRSTPPPCLALTFDDGFENFAEQGVPVLARYGFPATVFLVTSHCGARNDWPSQRPGIPVLPLMDWPRIRELSRAGVDFGAHTATHPDLTRLAEARARDEILSSRRRIEDAAGCAVACFAYPYGAVSEPVRAIVAEHFQVGCSARLGYVTPASRPEALERLDAYYLSRPSMFGSLMGPATRGYLGLRALLRQWNRPN